MKILVGSLLTIVLMVNTTEAAVQVEDYLGRKVQLDAPAKRIVALAPHIVENLYSIGAGDRIIGTVNYADYPAEAKEIPRVGMISSYSLESILALEPDLVILWYTGRGANTLEKLESLGLQVYASNPKRLADIPRSLQDYGYLTGLNGSALKVANEFHEEVIKLQQRYRKPDTVSVFYQIWNSPIQTLNGKHLISDVITLCGGENVFADEPTIAPKVSVESVLDKNPEVIVASGIGEERPLWLDDWSKWGDLNAVKNKQLFVIPPDIIQRHTVRIIDGAVKMCQYIDSSNPASG